MKLYVLVGDVVDSRHVAQRGKFGITLNQVLRELNDRFADELHTPFSRLKGVDEIGATLLSFKNGHRLVSFLQERLFPERMRLAVCHGEVDVEPNSKSISTMDGPAFHHAAAQLAVLKRSPYLFALQSGNAADSVVTALINQLLLQFHRWTPTQRKVAHTYRQLLRQQSVARKLHITQQTVSQALKSIDWYAFEESGNRVDEFLRQNLK